MVHLDSDGVFAVWSGYVVPKYFPTMTLREFNAIPEIKRRALVREIYQKEPNLFYNLPALKEMGVVLDALEKAGTPWCILTSGAEDHFDHELVVESKQLWFDKHFGVPADRIIVTETSGQKKDYAGRGLLLVDDFGRNCREWALAGGTAFWVRTEKPNTRDLIRHIGCFVETPHDSAGSILQIQ
ncbi:hypothetical protein BIZ83_gp020 [Erwinia phage vB_EamM_ChrisDB]|uniref:hypothetical protein n=1 Tax=Erwinia phage vB_EamM_ChrisDB TaxID=1883371 RepID=UPI00081CFFB3|nr:hypothetical protein BIZ83_gp020 [Erwinia phage vB_EamM_ChrisDB]ANZ48833.1 hypothetical protein CHRISDB_271 [Erwinia phage vB_EamM_ChrisDB]